MAATEPGSSLQGFEKMEITKFRWMVRDFCCRLLSLKEGSKFLAVKGIVLAILILVIGAGGSFLLIGLRSNYPPDYYQGISEHVYAYYAGAGALVSGILLLIYNIVLLNKVEDNQAAGVFKTIKVGCLISLYIELLYGFLRFLGFVIFLSGISLVFLNDYVQIHDSHLGINIVGIIGTILDLLITSLVIYAVHTNNSKIVEIYIYYEGILLVISFISLFVFTGLVYPALIIMSFIGIWWQIYLLDLFVQHLNMMIIAQPSENQLQLNDF